MVVGLFFAVNGLRQALFEPNLDEMEQYIRLSTLDHVLTQPVDSQILVSLRRVDLHALIDPVLGLGLVAAGLMIHGRVPAAGDVASFILLLVAALALLYALVLALMALSIPMVSADGLGSVSFSLVELARFPVEVYRQPLQTLLVVVPVALFTTVPAQSLLGRLNPWWLLASPAVAAVAVMLASLGWRAALRRYSGASA